MWPEIDPHMDRQTKQEPHFSAVQIRCQTVPFGNSKVPKGAFFERLKCQGGEKLNEAKLLGLE